MTPGVLAEVAAKSSVLLLLAWGLTRLMARSSAAARHVVWAAALAGTLAMPAVVRFAPTWRLSHGSATWVARAGAALDATWQRRGRRTDSEVWPRTSASGNHAPFVLEAGVAAAAQTTEAVSGSSAGAWRRYGAVLLVRLWVIGGAIGVASLMVGLFWAAGLVRRARPVTSLAWLTSHAEALRAADISATVRLLTSDRVGVPVVSGLLRPALILPTDSGTWDADRRRVVLLHELAHVRRRDCLMQTVVHLAWAIHWFNPLMILAVRRLRAEQERACDDLVLRMGTRATDYAGHLCDIASRARRRAGPVMWATLAIARSSRLEARVQAILDDARSRRSPSGRFCAAIAVAGFVGVVSLGALRPSGAASQAIGTLPSAALRTVTPYATLIAPVRPERLTPAESMPEPVTGVEPLVPRPRPPAPALTPAMGQAFLDAYCTTCHNSTRKTANLVFDAFNPDALGDRPDAWEKVVRRLRAGLHPPSGSPRPDAGTADAFSRSLEAVLDRADQATWRSGTIASLSDRELAERLARFLWNAEPDDTLRTLASSGRLRDPATLQQQVRRMIGDARSAALLTGFFGEWLSLKRLAAVKRDAAVFPEFDDALREAFRRETELFLASQVQEDHPVTDLLAANYTFLNDRLAAHYGIDGVTGAPFRRVRVADAARQGLLGHASLLSLTSFANRTSPVVRGKWLLETWLGIPPPAPPPNVPPLKPDDPAHSMRTRMEQHRKNPVCASCHTSMDALGLALENFDATGRWRTTEGDELLDVSGMLPDGTAFDGPAQLRRVLLDRRDAIVGTVTLKLLAYALGRPARYSDMPTVRAIVWDAAPSHNTWSSTIAGIVQSPLFQGKNGE